MEQIKTTVFRLADNPVRIASNRPGAGCFGLREMARKAMQDAIDQEDARIPGTYIVVVVYVDQSASIFKFEVAEEAKLVIR